MKEAKEKLKIHYLADIPHIEKISKGDWIDLRAAEDIEIFSGQFKLIPLGISMELPDGYEALVAPRSSTFCNYGIIMVNGLGIIDESYCGVDDEWHFPAFAIHHCRIKKGDRICQFRIIKHQPELEIVEAEEMSKPNRGGFGSTGRK